MEYSEFVMKTSDHTKFPEGRVFTHNNNKMTERWFFLVCILKKPLEALDTFRSDVSESS